MLVLDFEIKELVRPMYKSYGIEHVYNYALEQNQLVFVLSNKPSRNI